MVIPQGMAYARLAGLPQRERCCAAFGTSGRGRAPSWLYNVLAATPVPAEYGLYGAFVPCIAVSLVWDSPCSESHLPCHLQLPSLS